MPKTGDAPLRRANGIEGLQRLSDFRSINITFLRVECCGFQYFESCEKAHDGGPTILSSKHPPAGPALVSLTIIWRQLAKQCAEHLV